MNTLLLEITVITRVTLSFLSIAALIRTSTLTRIASHFIAALILTLILTLIASQFVAILIKAHTVDLALTDDSLWVLIL